MASLVYYSSETGNTRKFIEKLGIPALRVPASPKEGAVSANEPFVLVLPSYADGQGRGAIPKAIYRFLNEPANRNLLRGVIGSGNTNFGNMYCIAARMVAEKCDVPLLHKFELLGFPEDVVAVRNKLFSFWREQK